MQAECSAEVAALRLPFGLPFGREHFVVARAMLRRRQDYLNLVQTSAMMPASIAECSQDYPNARFSEDN